MALEFYKHIQRHATAAPDHIAIIDGETTLTYGELPDDKPIAMSHWNTEEGVRLLCGAVSGEAIGKFAQDNPSSESPEPFGA